MFSVSGWSRLLLNWARFLLDPLDTVSCRVTRTMASSDVAETQLVFKELAMMWRSRCLV